MPSRSDVIRPGLEIEVGGRIGTVGCFARRISDSKTVLLSNFHVLFGDEQNPVRRELRTGGGPCAAWGCCRGWLVGQVQRSRDAPPVTVRTTRDRGAVTESGVMTDCAIAALEPNLRFSNDIPGIGMITGTVADSWEPSSVDLGSAPRDDQYVRMYSTVEKCVRYGTIGRRPTSEFAEYLSGGPGGLMPPYLTNAHTTDRPPHPLSQYLVFPRPNPAEGVYPDSYAHHLDLIEVTMVTTRVPLGNLVFGVAGDSGNVVVNHRNEVVGLFWGAALREEVVNVLTNWGIERSGLDLEYRAMKSAGLVTPIHEVLRQLEITIPPDWSGTTPARGVSLSVDSDWDALERGLARLRTRLQATRVGRLLVAKIARHAAEARRLVSAVREVGLAWHRHHGPMFLRCATDNLRDPAQPIPTTINGIERTRMLERMADQFLRHGSERLRRDTARYGPFILQHLAMATTFEQVARTIEAGARPRKPDGHK